MARIPQFTRTVLPQRAQFGLADVARQQGEVEAQQLRVNAEQIAGIGRATQQVAGAFLDMKRQEAQARNTTFVNEKAIEYKRSVSELEKKRRFESESDPDDFAKTFDRELKSLQDKFIKQAPSQVAKTALRQTMNDVRAGAFDKNLTWETEAKVMGFGKSVEKSVNDLKTIAYRRGQEGKEGIDDLLNDVDATTVAGSTFVNPDNLGTLNQKSKNSVAFEYFQGMAEVDPKRAQELLNTKEYDDLLSADDIQTLQASISGEAKSQANKRKAERDARENLIDSRIGLASEVAKSSADFNRIEQEINKFQPIYGETWANERKLKLLKARKDFDEKQESISKGGLFATGQASINAEEKEDRDALDNYYKAFTSSEQFGALDDDQQTVLVSDMVLKSKYVPSSLKGDLRGMALSTEPEHVIRAADIYDRVVSENPALKDQLGGASVMRRVQMVNDQIEAGVAPNEAVKMVDERLSPKNRANEDAVQAEINSYVKDNKVDFRKQAIDAFGRWRDKGFFALFSGGLDTKNALVQSQIDGAAAEYRTRFENAYRETRDFKQAEREASDEMGLWSVSQINPVDMVMKFSPEAYYQIENQKPDWIRVQAIADIIEAQKEEGSFKPRTAQELQESLYIVSDPVHTPRTAATGQPEYKIIIMEDGVPIDWLGADRYWRPDEQKERDALAKGKPSIEELKRKALRIQSEAAKINKAASELNANN